MITRLSIIEQKVDNFGDALDNKQVSYGEQEKYAIESRYIGPENRQEIVSKIKRDAIQQGKKGTVFYNAVEEAVKRFY